MSKVELEELIPALAESNIDRSASDEIIEQLKRYKNAQEEEYFTVLETDKEDMIHEFDDPPKWVAKIDRFTDDQMKGIATDVENQLLEHYWDALQLAVETELGGDKIR